MARPLNAYTQKSLREQIAFVSQKPFLFFDTVAANIAFGRNFPREEIENAAKRAHADEFIYTLAAKIRHHACRSRTKSLWRSAAAPCDCTSSC